MHICSRKSLKITKKMCIVWSPPKKWVPLNDPLFFWQKRHMIWNQRLQIDRRWDQWLPWERVRLRCWGWDTHPPNFVTGTPTKKNKRKIQMYLFLRMTICIYRLMTNYMVVFLGHLCWNDSMNLILKLHFLGRSNWLEFSSSSRDQLNQQKAEIPSGNKKTLRISNIPPWNIPKRPPPTNSLKKPGIPLIWAWLGGMPNRGNLLGFS